MPGESFQDLNRAAASDRSQKISVTVLSGGGDRPYLFGLATQLIARNVGVDIIGSDFVDAPEFHAKPGVRFLNLRGDQGSDVPFVEKAYRVLRYYARLIRYAATAQPGIFHILWNNKFEVFDRTLLMFYYKLLGKKIVLTVHNVNAARRDSKDSLLNRLTLKIQYRLSDRIFVHTEKMKAELTEEFAVSSERIVVIPFGINNAVPHTDLTPNEARKRLGIADCDKVLLFFGNIAPYKGLEYLTAAFQRLAPQHPDFRLIIAGWPKYCDEYWAALRDSIGEDVRNGRVILRAEYIPDEETEVYFKAADVLVLPYRHIYQSGVLFLGYGFGVPVLAADVGALKDEIVEGETGFVFRAEDPADLVKTVEQYFCSDLFANLGAKRAEIQDFAKKRYSWDIVGQTTLNIYEHLARRQSKLEAVMRRNL
jgi:D-inositol-3-phosphate glycosyltransferase